MHGRGRGNVRSAAGGILAACLAVGLTVAPAAPQQVVQRFMHFSLTADKVSLAWGGGGDEWVATGHCKLDYKAEHQATMTAPKMTFKLDEKGEQLDQLTTTGPTHMDLTTAAPNARHIAGDCRTGASFSETTQVLTMTGAVDVTAQDIAGPNPRTYRLTGEAFTADLKDRKMDVQGNQANVQMVQPQPAPEEKKPKPGGP
jgi:hypothetical protein